GFALVGARVDASRGCRQPASGTEFKIVDPRFQLRLLESGCGDGFARTLARRFHRMLDNHNVHGMPFAGIALQRIYTVVGAGHQHSAGSLFERENVLPAEASRFLQPVLSSVTGMEHATVFAVVDDANVERTGIFVVGQNGGDIAMCVTVVGSGPVGGAIGRGHHAAAVGGEMASTDGASNW